MSGELPSGAPLRQRQLADMLGVSQEPIKHAIRALSHEGLVIKPPRRTAVVAPIRSKLVCDVYEVRTQLDALVTRRVAALPADARTELCERLFHLVELSRSKKNVDDLVELDRCFHLEIYKAASNEVALSTYHSAWTIIGRAMSLLVSTNHQESSWTEHRELIKAIKDGEVYLVAHLSAEHCQNASRWLLHNAKYLMDNVDP